ncbi:hypothetical protein CVIRNUC_006515 [Coccomyxa viridis]|uniref:Uncharacterized protein n=1 Tax=Coccomyxa viridis TaxID=1274662 RepID=A0AAV1I7J1_9CHLO|nr:hypothetical protein CVIRNUC_006515 [Coccomyxa viridis]
MRPKFTTANGIANAQPRDLFDQLISNDSNQDLLADAAGHSVILPPRCRFLISDITRLKPLLTGSPKDGFECIVIDPPWENASAQRSNAYPTLPSRNLLGIPVKRLLHQGRGLLALWVTNRERHRRFVDAELLPAWGLRHVATWYWLKVTNDVQLVSPLDIAYRRPYEAILLCRPGSSASQAAAAPAHTAADHPGSLEQEQDGSETRLPGPDSSAGPSREAGAAGRAALSEELRDLVIAAVPGQHSRKPHLGHLLAQHLPPRPHCLEVFARELHAGWTSVGNEALLFQTEESFATL